MSNAATSAPSVFLAREDFDALIQAVRSRDYTVIGPIERDGVVKLGPVTSSASLPRGRRDEQDGGRYRLGDSDEDLLFEYVVGPDSPKRYLFPPRQELFTLHVAGERFVLDKTAAAPPKLAFLGVRPCELAAVAVQDRVFGVAEDQQTFRCESDNWYRQAREQALLIAVNCNRPGGTCFCASWGTGPAADGGYDVCLTELRAGFIVRSGSAIGSEILEDLPVRTPTAAELELEELKLHQARDHMGRSFDPTGVRELLATAIDHPHWDRVAQRCLGCGNCTLVCPTCFCSTVTDTNDLATGQTTRVQQWESCFTHQFSYTTAGPVRNTIRGRYRHWLRHKVCTWWEQFDTSGCVGCGRCITWCPVGIDLTEELAALGHDHGRTLEAGVYSREGVRP